MVVVGAGPVGLTAGLLLARDGVTVLIVERRGGTSVLPRATGVNVRSMEIFRSLGLERAIAAVSLPADGAPLLLAGESLVAPVRTTIASTQSQYAAADWPSPTHLSSCAQDQLEPVLVAAVGAQPTAQLRFGTELVSLTDRGDRVTATLRDTTRNDTDTVEADYLIGADGAHSTVRRLLGIEMTGRDAIADDLTILFRADLEPLLDGRRFLLYQVDNPEVRGILRPAGASGRWLLDTPQVGDTSAERCVQLIRAAVGVPDLEAEVLAIGAWQEAAMVADAFSRGRVFLCGDAAHRHTPGGAFGMNTGIQGAHNLAWKLAGVLHGWAGPALLATYQAERQPLARLTTRLSAELFQAGVVRPARPLGVVLGAGYDSPAIVPDGTPAPEVTNPIADYRPSARPGQRAPHAWLDAARTTSTLDLFGGGFVLLTGDRTAWGSAAASARTTGVPLRVEERDPTTWAGLYGIRPDGAVLVRPDGYVAARWPTTPAQPDSTLRDTIRVLTHRPATAAHTGPC